VVGPFFGAGRGSGISIHGCWQDSKFGLQLVALQSEELPPETPQDISRYAAGTRAQIAGSRAPFHSDFSALLCPTLPRLLSTSCMTRPPPPPSFLSVPPRLAGSWPRWSLQWAPRLRTTSWGFWDGHLSSAGLGQSNQKSSARHLSLPPIPGSVTSSSSPLGIASLRLAWLCQPKAPTPTGCAENS